MSAKKDVGLKSRLVWLTILVVALVGMTALPMAFMQPQVQAAPDAAPTPLSANYSAEKVGAPVKFWADSTVLTTSGASTAFHLAEAEVLDIQYVIDQHATNVNTVTFKLQFSNDGTNWVDGINVVASNATDASALSPFNNFGYQTRMYATVTNTYPVTITHLSALPRR